MVLAMARPFKHPVTGYYYFRRAVPDDLRKVIGKREEKRSLNTRDPDVARTRHAAVSREIDYRWTSLRQGARSVSNKEAHAIAGEFYRSLTGKYEADPLHESDHRRLAEVNRELTQGLAAFVTVRPHEDQIALVTEQSAIDDAVLDFLVRAGQKVDYEGLDKIKRAVAAALAQGHETLKRRAEGDYREDPDGNRFPTWSGILEPKEVQGETPEKYDLLKIYDMLAGERKHSAATIKKFRPIIMAVAAEVPDIRLLTFEWCLAWKDGLIAAGLSTKTIQEGYLAALRNVTRYAKVNRRLIPSNPMEGLTVLVKAPQRNRPEKGYTEAEAKLVLAATLRPMSHLLPADQKNARRWIPWLCCYTGARVGEIAQLRKQDIVERDGVWLVWITPEAGRTKDLKPRYVALHSHLIDQGFLAFVEKRADGPLFYDMSRRSPDATTNAFKKTGENIGRWVRSLGLDDPELQPSHGWRHRFKTLSRDENVKMSEATCDYMQGHGPKNVSRAYGDYKPQVLRHEIEKLPRVLVDT